MKDLDLTTLRLFVEVCDAQSIKRVAEREQVDASSITKRMAKLEDQFKTQLLKRVRQGVQATPEGALLSEHARRLVKDAQKISDKFMQRNMRLTGKLTIASHMGSMSSVLTDDLASFMLLHGHESVQLSVKEMVSKDVVQMVRDDRASFGVVWDNTETSDLQHVEYYKDKLAGVMIKSHPLAERPSISFEEMTVYDLVGDKHSRHTEVLLQRSGGVKSDDARIVVQVETTQSAIRLAAQGVGIYACQIRSAQEQALSKNIAVVPLNNKWANVRVKIIFKNNLLSALGKALIDHLAHQHQDINPELS
jgi:DNA-binding transcriptional LysR family regulator